MDLTVTFDLEATPPTADVEVEVPLNQNPIAPPVDLARGEWLVRWTLFPDQDVTAQFSSNGISLDNHPAGVTIHTSERISDTVWEITLNNDVESTNSFNYTISVDRGPSLLALAPVTTDDPTIAVSPDPIDS